MIYTDSALTMLRQVFENLDLMYRENNITSDFVDLQVGTDVFSIRVWFDVSKQSFGFDMTNGASKTYDNIDEFEKMVGAYMSIHLDFLPSTKVVADSYINTTGNQIRYEKFIGNTNTGFTAIYRFVNDVNTEVRINKQVNVKTQEETYLLRVIKYTDDGQSHDLLDSSKYSVDKTTNTCQEIVSYDIVSYVGKLFRNYEGNKDISLRRKGTNEFEATFIQRAYVVIFTIEFPTDKIVEFTVQEVVISGKHEFFDTPLVFTLDNPLDMDEMLNKIVNQQSVNNNNQFGQNITNNTQNNDFGQQIHTQNNQGIQNNDFGNSQANIGGGSMPTFAPPNFNSNNEEPVNNQTASAIEAVVDNQPVEQEQQIEEQNQPVEQEQQIVEQEQQTIEQNQLVNDEQTTVEEQSQGVSVENEQQITDEQKQDIVHEEFSDNNEEQSKNTVEEEFSVDESPTNESTNDESLENINDESKVDELNLSSVHDMVHPKPELSGIESVVSNEEEQTEEEIIYDESNIEETSEDTSVTDSEVEATTEVEEDIEEVSTEEIIVDESVETDEAQVNSPEEKAEDNESESISNVDASESISNVDASEFTMKLVKSGDEIKFIRFSFSDSLKDISVDKAKEIGIPYMKIHDSTEIIISHGMSITKEEMKKRMFSIDVTDDDTECENLVSLIFG